MQEIILNKNPDSKDSHSINDAEITKLIYNFAEHYVQANASLSRKIRIIEAENNFKKTSEENYSLISIRDVLIQSQKSLLLKCLVPFKLMEVWYRNRIPHDFGGNDFKNIVKAYKSGGFKAVGELIKRNPQASKFVIGNAYTSLARYLQKNNKIDQAVKAARLAYNIDPRAFRLKWLAFRLADNEEYEDADILLNMLEGKIDFSESEKNAKSQITFYARTEREYNSKIKLINRLNFGVNDTTKNKNNKYSSQVQTKQLAKICVLKGVSALFKNLKQIYGNNPQILATKLIQISRLVRDKNPQYEYLLAKKALSLDDSLINIRAFFWIAQKARKYLEAASVIPIFEKKLDGQSPEEFKETYNKFMSSVTSNLLLLRMVKKKHERLDPDYNRKRVCYILHNSLPYSSGGYATRANGVATALVKAGYDLHIVTRPGYPWDIVEELPENGIGETDSVAGITCHRIKEPFRKDMGVKEYIKGSAAALEAKFAELKPEIVIAASNHVTGLPALIAARKLGIPFYYEVRGLWEITRVSRENSFSESPAFHVQKIFETQVCKRADHVFTLTKGLKDELRDRGVPEESITLVPNACDYGRFAPMEKSEELIARYSIPADTVIIGYIGTFVGYEGLEDLAEACGILKQKGKEFRLMLVGNENASGTGKGKITLAIEEIAARHGYADWLIMPGRIPHEEVAKYYSLVDIAPFPRKPWPVCEIVSPMKPMEAMAMGKTVLVSSVGALAEMVVDNETGFIFKKGDVADMAVKLEALIDAPQLRKNVGEKASMFIKNERTWDKSVLELIKVIGNHQSLPLEETPPDHIENDVDASSMDLSQPETSYGKIDE